MKWDTSRIQSWSWHEHTPGAMVPEAGNAAEYQTGTWRTERPIWDESLCNHCMICWVFCPDSSILVKDEKMVGIDYYHCKGCGICAVECPRKAIDMISESEARAQEAAAEGSETSKVTEAAHA